MWLVPTDLSFRVALTFLRRAASDRGRARVRPATAGPNRARHRRERAGHRPGRGRPPVDLDVLVGRRVVPDPLAVVGRHPALGRRRHRRGARAPAVEAGRRAPVATGARRSARRGRGRRRRERGARRGVAVTARAPPSRPTSGCTWTAVAELQVATARRGSDPAPPGSFGSARSCHRRTSSPRGRRGDDHRRRRRQDRLGATASLRKLFGGRLRRSRSRRRRGAHRHESRAPSTGHERPRATSPLAVTSALTSAEQRSLHRVDAPAPQRSSARHRLRWSTYGAIPAPSQRRPDLDALLAHERARQRHLRRSARPAICRATRWSETFTDLQRRARPETSYVAWSRSTDRGLLVVAEDDLGDATRLGGAFALVGERHVHLRAAGDVLDLVELRAEPELRPDGHG